MLTFDYDDPNRARITLSFRVVCASGFTWEFCQTNIDDCVGVDCSGTGGWYWLFYMQLYS